jgi:cell division protein FtsW
MSTTGSVVDRPESDRRLRGSPAARQAAKAPGRQAAKAPGRQAAKAPGRQAPKAPRRQLSSRRPGAASSGLGKSTRLVAAVPDAGPRASRVLSAVRGTLEHKVILGAVIGLCLLGPPIVLSASGVDSELSGGTVWSLFIRQCIFMVIAVALGIIASRLQMTTIRRLHLVLPVAVLGLLMAVFVPHVGHFAGGSSRWIGAGPIQVQPSELMKLALIVFAADLLARRAKRPDHWRAVVRPLLFLLAVSAILILKQPDLGTAIVLACITFAMLFSAGVPLRTLSVAFVLVAVPAGYVALGAAYRRDRLLSFWNPYAHATGSGYQVVQSLSALGVGGVKGNGIGSSAASWGFLPNAHTDFVFAVIGGNLGIAGSLAVIAGFAAFGWAGLRVAHRERDPFTRFLAVGITCWIVSQAVINIGGVIDALPVTGIPLPFVSYGGSSLVVAMIGAGVLIGIAKRQAVTATR